MTLASQPHRRTHLPAASRPHNTDGVLPTRAAARLAALLIVLFALLGITVARAGAATPAPRLVIHAISVPTHLSQADSELCQGRRHWGEVSLEILQCDGFWVTVSNLGDATARGPIKVTDELPEGFEVPHQGSPAENVGFFWYQSKIRTKKPFETSSGQPLANEELCKVKGRLVTCEFSEETGTLAPGQRLELEIYVTLASGAHSGVNTASVSEAATTVASTSDPATIDPSPASFGFTDVLAPISDVDGTPYTQAGGHPYSFSTRIDFNTAMAINGEFAELEPTVNVGNPRDVVVDLPLGFLGTSQATPKCTFGELQSYPQSCPRDTIVGHITTEPHGEVSANGSIYNMVPEHGVAAEYGFRDLLYTPHVITAGVAPSPNGYVLRAVAKEIPELDAAVINTTFYGEPAAAQKELEEREGETPSPISPVPAFTNPADCSGGPLITTAFADAWQSPGAVNADGTPDVEGPGWISASSSLSESAPVSGCGALRFGASMTAKPDTSAADSPTGLNFELNVSQTEAPGTLATPPLRDARVVMPAGMTVNPASANGLSACSEAQIGYTGHGESELSAFTEAAPSCPESSKIGSVAVESPLVATTLQGSVYLAAQDENPFSSLLAAYIVIDDPTTGTIVKVPGKLETNPETGQITGVFDENPQIPFSVFKLRFFGGSRGELATPQSCGTFTTSSDLMPWSAPESGPDATPADSFNINSNCAFGFSPSFSAGTTNNQAGAFSPFTLTIARQDGEQHLTGLTVTTPPGLLGVLKSVVQCPEPQASEGKCGPESQIGETTVSSGVGPEPFVVKGGRVYLTGPYNHGPFGLSVVVPAKAGPFNLGNVVIRSSIRVDPTTSQITVVSDPLPLMVNSEEGLKSGIPSDLRTVNVTINRPGFEFNPTNCSPLTVTGTLTGAQGASVPVSSSFQAANCSTLKFQPDFTTSLEGKGSKANGAGLDVKVGYPSAPFNGYANIRSTKVELPIQLPSRLTTLQKACVASVFEANPAACPEGSNVGMATATTPLLNVPLSGPAYLVSHGGAAFPDLEIVLQGEGITVILDGLTDIKKGITSTTFAALPDTPVSGFELKLPTGPHSALGTNLPNKNKYSFCGQKLNMPTVITGQNGAVIKQDTKIAITGCPKVKVATNAGKLAAALKACHRDKNNAKRHKCEKAARKKFATTAARKPHKR